MKRSKKFNQRKAQAAGLTIRKDEVVVRPYASPGEGVPRWDAVTFAKLVHEKKWSQCLDAIFEFLTFFERNHYRGFSTNDIQMFNQFVMSAAFALTQPDFESDGLRAARLVTCGHLFSNIVALSCFETTDFLLRMLIPQGNLVKLLFAENPRANIQGNIKAFFDSNAELASLWYNTYLLGVGCPTQRQQRNLHKHIADIDDRWTIVSPMISCPMFTCTYFNGEAAKRAKVVMNNAVKKKCTIKFENNPDPNSIAIFSSKWHRNHAVYKSAGPLVEQLRGKYKLSLVWLGRDVPQSAVTDYFDKVYMVAFDEKMQLQVPEEVRKNDFQMIYFPDIGMIDEGIWLANHRMAPIQACGYGHPETTGATEIDYYIGGDIEKDATDYYTEKMVLIPGLAQHPAWPTAERKNSWVERSVTHINCVWGPDKYNFTMLKVLEQVNKRCGADKLFWHFYTSPGANRYAALVPFTMDVKAILPNSEVHSEVEYYDYMREAELSDFSVNSFPFGGYNTVIESMYLGLPIVCLSGNRFYNRAGNAVNTMIGMDELNAEKPEQFIEIISKMVSDRQYMLAERAKLAGTDLKAKLFQVGPKHFLNAVNHIIANHPLQTNPTLIGELYGEANEEAGQGNQARTGDEELDPAADR